MTTARTQEGPLGVYSAKDLCAADGKRLEQVLKRKFECIPADEVAIRYYRGERLGDEAGMLPVY